MTNDRFYGLSPPLRHRYLHLAVSEGAEEIVRDLIRITPHPCLLDIQNDLLQSALHLGVLVSNFRLVRMLLLAGAEVSALLFLFFSQWNLIRWF